MSQTHTTTRRSRAYLNLFWTIPPALTCGGYLILGAAFSRCGFDGCTNVPGGWDSPAAPIAFQAAAYAGLLLSFAIFAVPWTRSWSRRTLIAAAVGLVCSALSLWNILFLLGSQN